jgi:Zn finger protein HypA/HybF involved in hydrogenase expression
MPIVACSECYSRDVTLLTGEEFAVVSLELTEV